MSSVQMRFEEEGFQIEFEREQTWSIAERLGEGRGERRGGGHSRSLRGAMYEKARFSFWLSLVRGTVMRPASAERTERVGADECLLR